MAFDHDGDCGVFNMSPLEAARRRGLGTALTARHFHDAVERGCSTASLQSTPVAERVYAGGWLPRPRPIPRVRAVGASLDVEIAWYTAERVRLRSLFALAEDSPQRLEASMDQGRVLVATDDGQIVAHLQLVESDVEHEVELGSIAVIDQRQRQRQGIGRALIERAIADCRAEGLHTLLVATASADIGNLRFHQRLGFACSASNVTPSRPPMATRMGSRSTGYRFATASG